MLASQQRFLSGAGSGDRPSLETICPSKGTDVKSNTSLESKSSESLCSAESTLSRCTLCSSRDVMKNGIIYINNVAATVAAESSHGTVPLFLEDSRTSLNLKGIIVYS